MKKFIKSFGKTFILGISFALGVLTVYAASNLINSVTEQTISKGDQIGSGWFQEVNDWVVNSGATEEYIDNSLSWGNYVELNENTTYTSSSNLLINVFDDGSQNNCHFYGYVNGTLVAYHHAGSSSDAATLHFAVPKGATWKVEDDSNCSGTRIWTLSVGN